MTQRLIINAEDDTCLRHVCRTIYLALDDVEQRTAINPKWQGHGAGWLNESNRVSWSVWRRPSGTITVNAWRY